MNADTVLGICIDLVERELAKRGRKWPLPERTRGEWRSELPYVVEWRHDGWYLLDRRYCFLWHGGDCVRVEVLSGANALASIFVSTWDLGTPINEATSGWLFDDSCTPWHDRDAALTYLARLRALRVANILIEQEVTYG